MSVMIDIGKSFNSMDCSSFTNHLGNHGEDVKECYYYHDSTPTHSYMKALYKYPQNEYPYEALVDENKSRGQDKKEYEIMDTGKFLPV